MTKRYLKGTALILVLIGLGLFVSAAPAVAAPSTFNQPPSVPTRLLPAHGTAEIPSSPKLRADVDDPEQDNLTVSFYGRAAENPPAPPPDFTMIVLPDTQYYVARVNGGSPEIFYAQTQWIVDRLAERNIVFVTQLGDLVESGDTAEAQWQYADTAMRTIEDPLTTGMTHGLPYGIVVGNHDQSPEGDPNGSTTFYNRYFGAARFQGRSYYGGHYGSNNDNHYQLFSGGGLDFIVVHLEFDRSHNADVLAWADSLLAAYSDRRAIIVSHYIIKGGDNADLGPQGQATYDALKDNPNLFLMLSGHVVTPTSEGQRQDTFEGRTVYALMSDYQNRANGGNGWLRILEFSPANNEIRVKTYSPWLDQFETDADSQFNLPYDMGGAPAASRSEGEQFAHTPGSTNEFQLIGTHENVASGSRAGVVWQGLTVETEYEWYVTVSDGTSTTTGPVSRFTTGSPLSDTIYSFIGKRKPAGVRLKWVTASEQNVLGMNVLRANKRKGEYVKTNAELIPARMPGNDGGARYGFMDRSAPPDRRLFYKLQVVDSNGTTQEIGPFKISETALR